MQAPLSQFAPLLSIAQPRQQPRQGFSLGAPSLLAEVGAALLDGANHLVAPIALSASSGL